MFNNRDQIDLISNMGTALPGYVAEDLLRFMDVNPSRHTNDAAHVVQKTATMKPRDLERAAHVLVAAPQVQGLLGSAGSGIIVIDGHFDRTKLGMISPLSCVSATLAQAIRQQSQHEGIASQPTSPLSPQAESGSKWRSIILEYYCALHTADDDDLRGPQGLMRCLTTQLILSLVSNECVGVTEPLNLPHLRDGEEQLLTRLDFNAICRLFVEIIRLIPTGVKIYCIVDSWSAYERDDLWRTDYDTVLNSFRVATEAIVGGGPSFKLILTSPTACHWLGDFILPSQKISLRAQTPSAGRNWQGPGMRGIMGLARAATMPNNRNNAGYTGMYAADEYRQGPMAGDHDRRTST